MTDLHGCSSSDGVFICFSGNGIGSARYGGPPRIERCAKCGTWWRMIHNSPYLSLWSPIPRWLVWLRWHRRWKAERKAMK